MTPRFSRVIFTVSPTKNRLSRCTSDIGATQVSFSYIRFSILEIIGIEIEILGSDPLDLAELHSFRLVYFKHKEIFLVVCIVSDEGSVYNVL